MAHNEEKVIKNAIMSALDQRIPDGYSTRVVIVANGCNDRTEEIVRLLKLQYPNKIDLVAIREKGKTKAINRAIKYFGHLINAGFIIPYVIFLDADCEFLGKEVLINFINRFKENPQLCAVAANCLPDVFSNARKDIVAATYRAIYRLGDFLQINTISGMCYAIRFDILNKINFPELQFNEDMFLTSRLNGRFCRDKNIKIVFKTPPNLNVEIKRRTRQEIGGQRYHNYYSYLKQKGVRVELFETSLGDDYRWRGAQDNSWFKAWFKLKGRKEKLFALVYVSIRMWAKVSALWTMAKIKKNMDLDFWKVLR